jgi:GH18 family chitinase
MNFKNFSTRLSALIAVTALTQVASVEAKVVAYYENWAIYCPTPYNPQPSSWTKFANNIDVFNYAFGTFNLDISNGPTSYVPTGNWELYYSDSNDVNGGALLVPQVQKLKAINPNMKMIWSIGGWNFTQPQTQAPGPGLYGTYGWYSMPFFSMIANNQDVSNPTTTGYNNGATGYGTGSTSTAVLANSGTGYGRGYGAAGYNNAKRYGSNLQNPATDGCQTDFINSALYIVNSSPIGWDGLDLDWEYPGRIDRGGIGACTIGGQTLPGDFGGLLTILTRLRAGMNPGKILTMPTASAGDSPFLADVAWAAGTFADGTAYPSSAAVITALGISPTTTTNWPTFGTNGNTYTYSCFNEYMYFLWMTLCAHECDWFNVMTYDYFGPYFTAYSNPVAVTGPLNAHLAPLYPAPWNTSSQLSTAQTTPAQTPTVGPYSLCVDRTIGMYLHATIPATTDGGPDNEATPAFSIAPGKLILGVPAYGRSYVNTAGTAPTPGSATLNPPQGTPATPYGKQLGYYNYYEIMDDVTSEASLFNNLGWDATSQTSYASSSVTGYFASFDYAGAPPLPGGTTSTNSIANKCSYAKAQGLGGVMIWAIDTDDTANGFPVLNAVINGIGSPPQLATPGQSNIKYGPTNGRN